MNTLILIVDDDADLTEGLRWYLEAEGYEIIAAPDGESAVEVFRTEKPDLVILDVMMPKMDGIKVCEIISRESDALIMMLSARDNEIDKVRALKLGADDYVTKPFNVSELVARIQALLRRRGRSQPAQQSGPKSAKFTLFKWGNLELSLEEHRASIAGTTVDLTAMEFDLLSALMGSPQIVLSREHLVERIWGWRFLR